MKRIKQGIKVEDFLADYSPNVYFAPWDYARELILKDIKAAIYDGLDDERKTEVEE